MQSMTGFASKTFVLYAEGGARSSVTMSLKALNSRYFETNCKMPHAISHLETTLVKLFKKKLRRGYIHFMVHMSNPNLFRGSVEPATAVVDAYLKAINTIKEQTGVRGEIELSHVLALPNIFSVEEQQIDETITQKIIDEAGKIIDVVIEERIREGKVLADDLVQRFGNLEQEILAIEVRAKQHVQEQQQKVQAVLQEMSGDESALAEARKSALYVTLDKIDVHEEVVRFKSHLENIGEHLASDAIEKGKRLDFVLQELAREINTIAAKCSDSEIGSRAINVKVEIEKAREQVQNVV